MDNNNKFYFKEKQDIKETHVKLSDLIGDQHQLEYEERFIEIKGLQLYSIKYYSKVFKGKEKGTVVGLHGGPAFCHNYILPLKLLANEGYTVLFYDQIGCGKSTFVEDPVNDTPWLLTLEYYIDELKIVIDSYQLSNFYLYGSSWGTMLAQEFAIKNELTKGLKGLILDGALADSNLYIKTQWRDRISSLPTFTQQLLRKLTDEKKFDDPLYQCLDENLSKHFICRTIPPVDEYIYSSQLHNPIIYKLMQGESEFTTGGLFKDWSSVDRLFNISVPCLVLAGEYDTMSLECQQQLVDHIPYSFPLVIIPRSSHCKLLEEPFYVIDEILKFLKTVESVESTDIQLDI